MHLGVAIFMSSAALPSEVRSPRYLMRCGLQSVAWLLFSVGLFPSTDTCEGCPDPNMPGYDSEPPPPPNNSTPEVAKPKFLINLPYYKHSPTSGPPSN